MITKLSDQDNRDLVSAFSIITDTRDQESCTYSLTSILFIVLSGTICGMKGWDALNEFAEAKKDWICKFVQLPKTVPSADTLRRVFESILPIQFEKMFNVWLSKLCKKIENDSLHIDGKATNSKYDHVGGEPFLYHIHIYSEKNKILMFHKKIRTVGEEPKAAEQIISMIGVEGATITGDANFCTRELTNEIEAKKSKYYFALKGNRGDIFGDVKQSFIENAEKIESQYTQEEKGHGRKETREVVVMKATEDITKKAMWGNLSAIIKIDRTREINDKKENEVSYYISNAIENANIVYDKIKAHWLVENDVHWKLDVIFEEDGSRVRNKNSAANLGVVRKAALSLLQKETTLKKSTAAKQRIASWSGDYLEKVLRPILRRFT